jgi:hypothetical protein
MTLAALNGFVAYPGHCEAIGGVPAVQTDQTLTTAGTHYQALVSAAREAMAISHVGFRSGAVAGSPTVDCRIETVDASGNPSGTLWPSSGNGVTPTVAANTWILQALGATANIAAGQVFALMVKLNAGTSLVVQRLGNLRQSVMNLPYEVTNVSGSAVKQRPVGYKMLIAGSNAVTYYNILNAAALTTLTNNTIASGNARGLRFQVPFKCRCVGIRHYQGTGVGDYNAVMYDNSGTPVELSSSSTAYPGVDSVANAGGNHYSFFDNPVTLNPGTWYRAVLEATTATAVNTYTATLPSALYRSSWAGGVNQHYTFRTSGTWDDTHTAEIPLMDILIDQLDDGAGGGLVAAIAAFLPFFATVGMLKSFRGG